MTPLEQKIMDMLLAGSDPELDVLRAQYASASVAKRDMTGAGFYTWFSVDRRLPAVSRSMGIDDVMVEVTGGSAPLGFILWVEDGFINNLEGWSAVGDWPDPDLDSARVYYVHRAAPDSVTLVETEVRDLGFALHDSELYRTPAEKRLDQPPGWWARTTARLAKGARPPGAPDA